MTIERSHGKARPALVRASDLKQPETERNPTAGRGEAGRFAPGNRIGMGARWKATLKKTVGSAEDGEAGIVASDAKRIMVHVLRSLPSDAAPVRVMAGIHARHTALNAYFTAKAEAAGLDTERGLELLNVASRESQRAERTLVTAHDLARVHVETEKNRRKPTLAGWGAEESEPTE